MKRILIAISALMLLIAANISASASYPTGTEASVQNTGTTRGAAQGATQAQQHPKSLQAVKSDRSIPLRDIVPTQPRSGPERNHFSNLDTGRATTGSSIVDSLVHGAISPLAMPTPIQNFDGMMNYAGVLPPDTVGEVGLNHYVQMTNSGFQIFSKTGATLYGPAATSTLFRGFGGVCETHDDGDPIVLYDQLADRWILTQFISSSPYGQCIAVSTGPDPTGAYYRYYFLPGTPNNFGDYEKLSVWPDGIYMSTNEFAGGSSFVGAGNYAFNKAKMYVGDPTAEAVYFFASGVFSNTPADLDGYTQPPAGSPAFFYALLNPSTGSIGEYKFHADFVTPASSTFVGPVPITVAPWNDTICGTARGRCIDQPGTALKLESLVGHPMFRPAYRNYGTYEDVMLTHTVNATGGNPGIAGIRFYEIRSPNATPTVFQQGTYAPADNTHRFMPSIAQDHMGNAAVGFSASNATNIYPSVYYAGRLVTDPVGQLSQGEAVMFAGSGSNLFPSAGRWGDYADMSVDPTDDCTFWFTTEYYRITGNVNWRTRIGSFKFPNCVNTPPPTTTPAPTQSATPTPQASPTSCPGGSTVTGSITNSDPTQAGRRAGTIASSCAVPQPCPGASSLADPRHYDSYTYVNNTNAAQCITVSINALGCTEAGIGSFTYLNSFDPNNLCNNYLANSGRNGAQYSYSFSVPANTTYVVVVMELEPNLGCPSYTLTVNQCSAGGGGTPTSTITPVASSTPLVTATTGQGTATASPTACGTQPNWQLGPTQTPARYTHQGAVAADGNFYVSSGQDIDTANSVIPDFSRFNATTNTWTSLGTVPAPAGQVSVAANGSKIYVAGGFIGSGAITSTLRIYDIPSNSWSFGASMPGSEEAGAGVSVGGKFYVIGGDNLTASLDTTYIYDIATNTWTTGPALPAPRTNLNGTTYGGLVYVYGGEDAAFAAVNTLYSYNPATNMWTTLATNPLGTADGNYAPITPYGVGTLLVAGGSTVTSQGAFNAHNFSYFYNIASNSWSTGPNLNIARTGHAIGTLADGRVIVYSGLTSGTPLTLTSSSEILPPRLVCTTPTVGPSSTRTATIPATSTGTATRTVTVVASSTTGASATSVSTVTGSVVVGTSTSTRTSVASPTSGGATSTPQPTSTVCPISFTDVPPDSTFYPFIRCLACRGVISGYSDGTFRPGNDITRGQIAKMVSNAAGFSEDPGPQIYEDVNTNNPFFIWINRLSNRGFMGGYPCGTIPTEPCINPDNRPYFRPFANATRGQLAKIVANTAGVGGTPTGLYYTDVPEDNPFYLWIMRLTNIGVMSGYPCGGPGEPCDDQNRPYFRPFANVTRGQASKIVANTFFPNCQTPARP